MIFGLNHNDISDDQKFADHVLVFMLRGIAKKWKQPYALLHIAFIVLAQQKLIT